MSTPNIQDVDGLYDALDLVREKAQAEESISAVLLEELTITGIEGVDNSGVRVCITGRTEPNEQLDVQRFLRRQVMDVLAERQITVAQISS